MVNHAESANDNRPGEGGAGVGKLDVNIIYFARALRAAGVPVGPAQIEDALTALSHVGVGPRSDFYWTLHSIFVRRREHSLLFSDAFELFWKKRGLLEQMMAMLMPSNAPVLDEKKTQQAKRRVSDALFANVTPSEPKRRPRMDIDARETASDAETLQRKDFEQMTQAELERARAEIRKLRLVFRPLRTRRFLPSPKAERVDPRRTFKASLRAGGAIALRFRAPLRRPPPVVALCDISGSMGQYSRVFLHFLHALTTDQHRVHTFLFGTRLTNVTRVMRRRDPDEAIAGCSDAVQDWSGGTRISSSLERFNKDWSRRVLTQGPTVLLITDGLERDDPQALGKEMSRLHRSCRRLIWLNPLLRYEKFEPKARGIQAMLPHVDAFCPVHNVQSIADLSAALLADAFGQAPGRAQDWARDHAGAA